MNSGRTVFSQLISFLPDREFRRCVSRYHGDHRLREFSCWDQYLTMAFAQRTYRESLRDIEACLRSLYGKLSHMGFRSRVARSTLADANESHDGRIYADFAQVLIGIARPLYAHDPIGVDLEQSLYALERGYIDFERLFLFPLCSAFFVVRTKGNVLLQRRYSRPVDKTTGLRSDHTVILTEFHSAQAYPDPLRRITYFDAVTNRRLKFLTNNFLLPALTIAQIYKCRWQIELFFQWIKQHLRIKSFYGTSENAVKTPIWIAVSIYVLVAIVRKRLGLGARPYQILQILRVSLFEKVTILHVLINSDYENQTGVSYIQLPLFNL